MSRQAAQSFRDQVCQNQDLQRQMLTAMESAGDLQKVVALGESCGCEFTTQEIAEAFQNPDDCELSEAQLESVAGGSLNFSRVMKGIANVMKNQGKFSSTALGHLFPGSR